MPSVVKVPES